jgi:glycosyltransferase involved in cell wall biosynthesis
MPKRIAFAWCGLVAVVTYPLAAVAIRHLPGRAATTAAFLQPRSWVVCTLALLAGIIVLPRRLWPIFAQRPARAAEAVTAWVLISQSIWAFGNYAVGATGLEDVWLLRLTLAVQAILGYAGAIGASLLAMRFAPIWSMLACLPLFPIAFPAMLGEDAESAAGYLATALFFLANAGCYRLLMARYRFDGYSLALYGLASGVWIVAAHLGWMLGVFVAGMPGALPIWLPVATVSVQLAVAVLLPVADLAARGQLSLVRFLYDRAAAERPVEANSVVEGTTRGKRAAWIISYTGVSNEPRVRRQADALVKDGWRVIVCGFDGHSPRPAEWTYIRLPASPALSPWMRRLLYILHGIGAAAAVYAKPTILARRGALLAHLCNAPWLTIRHHLRRVIEQSPDLRPHLVIAHDYHTADVGYLLSRLSGARFSVDCHEYAVEQSSHDPRWVKWRQPQIRLVEDHYLGRADLVTTVCDGIADLLNADHKLQRPALVVRSVPLWQPQPFRPTGERIKVLYHGGIWHVRQLHVAIESMRRWRPEFDLVLRGDGDPSYIAELQRLVRRYDLDHRVFFEPVVPFDRIVPEANRADIGYLSYLNFSRQIEFALPNKFFEYVMAGLALAVGNFAEMGLLTRRYGFGKLIPQHTPDAIADTINSFTREEIDRCKMASIAGAQELNWEQEKQRLLAAYNDLMNSRGIPDPVPELGPAPAVETVA